MVYCGKPSKGCLACRSRKTRCDRATPSCSQCIRAKRECPGYRNQLDLMFRNESQAVIGKVTTQKSRKQKISSIAARSTPKLQVARVKSPTPAERAYENFLPSLNQNYVPEPLSVTVEDRALGFYKNKAAIWLRNFDLVETICNQSNTDEYLRASLSAVGLASYAGLVRSPQLMNRARKDYGKALQLTNEALRSPTEFTKDSTLFAVISLGVFEAVAGSGAESLAAWTKHLAGASELVKLRGPAQFRSDAGQRMFVQICSNHMVESVQYRKPMPPHILALRAGAKPYVDTEDPAWRISDNLLRFIEVRNTAFHTDLHPREIIKQALKVDADFIDIVDNMHAAWHPKRYYSDAHPDAIWNGFFEVYTDFWVLQMHNTLRIFRIQIHQLVREQINSLRPDFAPVFSNDESTTLLGASLGVMQEMQNQILACIPQYAPYGITSFPSTSPPEPSNAYHVFWPMFLVGTMDIATPNIQKWIFNRFRTIAKEGGIQHADVLADSMIGRQTEAIVEGIEKGEYSVPLNLAPFEWKLDGWAMAHGVILSAQVNKPTVMRSSPKMLQLDLNGIPAGWTGPPPPGWVPPPGFQMPSSSGTQEPQSSQGPPAGFSGIPAGWVGPPPPGWVPPPGFKMPRQTASGKQSNNRSRPGPACFSSPIPAGWTGPPPPGWVSPPGFKMPLQNGNNTQLAKTVPQPALMGQPPAGWVGSPPPGWVPPSGFKIPPSNGSISSESTRNVSVDIQVAVNRSAAGIPVGSVGPPPPGWIPPPGLQEPPSGYSEQSSTEWNGQSTPLSANYSRNPLIVSDETPPNSQEDSDPKRYQSPSNAPPPSGWDERLSPPPSSSSAANSSKTSPVEEQPPSNPSRGPPAGWVGPPPSNWQGEMPPAAGGQFSQFQMQIPESSQKLPNGWTGPRPAGWQPPTGFTMLPNFLPTASNNSPSAAQKTIPEALKAHIPPPGWQPPPGFSMPPGCSSAANVSHSNGTSKGHERRRSKGSMSKSRK